MSTHDRDPHLYATDTYEDITEELKQYAANMKEGELAALPNFKLYDAINAFEIGKPRMDTGLKYRSLEQDLENLPTVDSAEDVAAVIDIINAADMAWQSGHTLMQTVFASLFVEQELRTITQLDEEGHSNHQEINAYLESRLKVESWRDVLDIYILATLKTCSLVIQQVNAVPEAVLPEEDFHPGHASYYLLGDVHVDLICKLVDAAQRFAAKDKLVTDRLALRISWMHVLRQKIAKKHTHQDKALELLSKYEPVDTAKFDVIVSDGIQGRTEMFSLQQTVIKWPIAKALEQWSGLVSSIKDLSRVTSLTKSADLLGFFLQFASQNNLPLVRAILKSIVRQSDLLGLSGKTWVVRDIKEVSFPQWDNTKNKQLYDQFLAHASACYMDLLAVFCENRARQREGLVANVATWDSLQVTAEQVDEKVMQLGLSKKLESSDGQEIWALEFSSWVYLRKLQIMLWVLLFSFELDIVLEWEFAYMYWYGVQLGQRLLDQLTRLKAYFEQHNLRSSQPGYAYLVALEVEARALTQVCSAEYLVHLSLQKLGIVKTMQPPFEGTTPELLYGLRFQPYESVGVPAMAKLETFNKLSENFTVEVALEAARNSVTGAKSLLSTLTKVAQENNDLKLLMRSTVGLQIVISQIEKVAVDKAADKLGKHKLELVRDGYHPYFSVPKVSQAQVQAQAQVQ